MSTATLPAGASDDGRMSLIDHLIELRTRVIRCAYAVALGAVVGWFLYPWLLHGLLRPYNQIQSLTGGKLLATAPTDAFALRLKLTTYFGLAVAMPVILWQIWRFVSPGLYKHERRYALPFVVSAVVLFVMGAAIAYWTLPKALDWLANIGGSDITPAYTAEKYLQLIAYMMLAFGICFEFPILLVFLQLAGIVKNAQLRRVWRQIVVGITVIVAVATPSNDPISMLALSIPLVVFFFAAAGIGWVVERRRTRKAAAGSA